MSPNIVFFAFLSLLCNAVAIVLSDYPTGTNTNNYFSADTFRQKKTELLSRLKPSRSNRAYNEGYRHDEQQGEGGGHGAHDEHLMGEADDDHEHHGGDDEKGGV
jgi:hypothetical protein